jgi:uncharacterized membrane protein
MDPGAADVTMNAKPRLLTSTLVAHHGKQSALAIAVGADRKGLISLVLYSLAIPAAFVDPRISCAIYTIVALIWLIPDQRIERLFTRHGEERPHARSE